MKRTELEKQLGHKINNRINNSGSSSPFTKNEPVVDRKEQRRRDQALGLIPFAVKLNEELVAKVQDMASAKGVSINEMVADLLKKGMEK